MCGNPFASKPDPPPLAKPIPVRKQPRLADEGVRKAGEDTRDRARRIAGSTLLTSPGGLSTSANTNKKTLLGA